MEVDALSPSPVARFLLELEQRQATGRLEVGGRRVVLHGGAITDVLPAEGDLGLLGFLLAAGRLTEAQSQQLPEDVREDGGTRLDQEVLRRELLDRGTLRETRRALWLDRLVRGLSQEEQEAAPPRHLEPHSSPAGPYRVATLPLVLDALTRRAGHADAERIGHHAAARFEWLEVDAQTPRAQRWADLGEEPGPRPVSAVLLSHPGAASRIAALVRAGLARLTRASDPPPAPEKRRAPSIPPPTGRRAAPPPPSDAPPAGILDPGLARLPGAPLGITPVEPWFAVGTAPLDDPLDALERRIAAAEQGRLPGPQRARLWLEFAHIALEHYGSVEEAARAAREAAAADPDSAEAHHTAAEHCASVGQPALAYAYAKAAATLTEDSRQRMQRLSQVALLATRCGKAASGLRALQQACADPAADAWVFEQYARALYAHENLPHALEWASKAAAKNVEINPVGAQHLLAWANSLAPANASLAAEYASQLAQAGLGEAASVVLLRAARTSQESEERASLRGNAAIRAELGGRPDLAAEALLDSFEEDPRRVTLHEPLVANLEAAGLRREAALLAEEIAGVCPAEQRGPWLLRAVRVHLERGGCGPLLRRLLGEALKCPGSFETGWELTQELAQREESMRVFTDVLEVALDDGDVPRELRAPLVPHLLGAAAELGAPALERWGYSLRQEIEGTPLSEEDMARLSKAGEARTQAIVALESRIESAHESQQRPLSIELARLWRDDPQRRIRAIKQYSQILEQSPDDEGVALELCELLWLAEDLDTLVRNATTQQPHQAHPALLLSGAYAARMRGEFELVADICLSVLDQDPHDDEALALLARAERAGLPVAQAKRVTEAQLRGSTDPRRRARALTRLADSLLMQGEILDALAAAERALAAEPRAGRAAEIVTEHHAALDESRAVSLPRAARLVLGDHPTLLWQLAQAAGLAEDHGKQIEALETLARQSPFLAGAAVELLRTRARASDDPTALLRCIETALSPARRTESSALAVQEGLDRLWSLGEHERTLRLAVTAADALGEEAEALLGWAVERAAERGMSRAQGELLERLVARLTDGRRLERLCELARLEQVCERPASEVRTWLRVLAIHPAHDEALSRLSALYGAAGDPDRMLSVLTLRLEAAHDPEVRARALLDLAAASLVVADDSVTAAEMVRGAMAEQAELDETLLSRGIGLLLSRSPQTAFDLLLELAADEGHAALAGALYQEAVTLAATTLQQPGLALGTAISALEQVPERTQILLLLEKLALEEDQPEAGSRVYDELIERALGMHGRRALLYRKARFLERGGLASDALDAYLEGFRLAPSAGVVLASIERLAARRERPEALVECLLQLAPLAPFASRRSELYARASEICERQLEDPERALSIDLQSFEASPETATARRAARTLQRLGRRDPEARARAIEPWRAFLEGRAEQAWDAAGKVHALLRLGILLGIGMEDLEELCRVAKQAIDALDGDTDDVDEGATRAGLYAEVAQLLIETSASVELAQSACDHGLALRPDHEQLQRLKESLSTPASVAPPRPDTPTDEVQAEQTSSVPETSAENGTSAPRTPTGKGLRAVSDQPYSGTHAHFGPTGGVVRVPGALRMGERPSSHGASSGGTLPPPAIAPLEPVGADRAAESHGALPPESEAPPAARGTGLESLCVAVAEGDQEAAATLLRAVHGRSGRAERALDELLARLRGGATSHALLTSLATLGPLAGREEIRVVAREAMLAGDALEATARDVQPVLEGEGLGEALALARSDEETETARRLLELTWQHGAPLFRRPLHSYGVGTEQLLDQHPDDPIGRAYAAAAQITGQSCELYDASLAGEPLTITCTTPPAILVSHQLDLHPAALRMRFAACLERTRDDALLISALAPEEAERLVDALRAAFGPTSGRDSLEREAAAVAAELWRTIPPLVQREMTELFRTLKEPLSRAPLALAQQVRAARVGLLGCGHVGVALHHAGVAVMNPALSGGEPLAGPLARALLGFAFSEPYLALRAAG